MYLYTFTHFAPPPKAAEFAAVVDISVNFEIEIAVRA